MHTVSWKVKCLAYLVGKVLDYILLPAYGYRGIDGLCMLGIYSLSLGHKRCYSCYTTQTYAIDWLVDLLI